MPIGNKFHTPTSSPGIYHADLGSQVFDCNGNCIGIIIGAGASAHSTGHGQGTEVILEYTVRYSSLGNAPLKRDSTSEKNKPFRLQKWSEKLSRYDLAAKRKNT